MNNLIPLIGLGALLWFMFKPEEAAAATNGNGNGNGNGNDPVKWTPTARPIASAAILPNPRGGCNSGQVAPNSGAEDLVRVT